MLLLLMPIIASIWLLVFWRLGRPAIFRQLRPGWNEKPFFMLKFRSMTSETDSAGNLLSDSERLTKFGRFLRKTSLDELPELWNVLKGEMSLVGPRPLLMRYSEYFTQEERQRFTVRPGITGLAQINGRNDLSWDSRIRADVEYVQTLSLRQDINILCRTLVSVVTRSGVRDDPGKVMLNFDEERRERLRTSQSVLS
jgi:lipopolysaccharide/colanic/teichoic acid biosynthesis glycosyltransferase